MKITEHWLKLRVRQLVVIFVICLITISCTSIAFASSETSIPQEMEKVDTRYSSYDDCLNIEPFPFVYSNAGLTVPISISQPENDPIIRVRGNITVQGMTIQRMSGSFSPTGLAFSLSWADEPLKVSLHVTAQPGETVSFKCQHITAYTFSGRTLILSDRSWTAPVEKYVPVTDFFKIAGSTGTPKSGETMTFVVSTASEGVAAQISTTGLEIVSCEAALWLDNMLILMPSSATDDPSFTSAVFTTRVTAQPGTEVTFRADHVIVTDNGMDNPAPSVVWTTKATDSSESPEDILEETPSWSTLKSTFPNNIRTIKWVVFETEKTNWLQYVSEEASRDITIVPYWRGGWAMTYADCKTLRCTGQHYVYAPTDTENIELVDVVVMGDVQGSGLLGISQLVRLAQAVNGTDPLSSDYAQAGDLNCDGHLSLSDVIILARWITGDYFIPSGADYSS